MLWLRQVEIAFLDLLQQSGRKFNSGHYNFFVTSSIIEKLRSWFRLNLNVQSTEVGFDQAYNEVGGMWCDDQHHQCKYKF